MLRIEPPLLHPAPYVTQPSGWERAKTLLLILLGVSAIASPVLLLQAKLLLNGPSTPVVEFVNEGGVETTVVKVEE
jgi:hypothetical protein